MSDETSGQTFEYVVLRGDCVASIAAAHGLHPSSIWDHPANSLLRRHRKYRHILYPGDVVTIPIRRLGLYIGATDQRHRFVIRGEATILRLILKDEEGNPRAHLPYTLRIGGTTRSAETDAKGFIEEPIPPDIQEGTLAFGSGFLREVHRLRLGHLDPATETCGLKMRLTNLGFFGGDPNGTVCDATRRAISSFQKENGLEPTGQIDEETRARIVDCHGS